MSTRPGEPRVFTWDWKDQPAIDDIAAHVNAAMFTGGTFMYVVPAQYTDDSYAIVLSPVALSPAEVVRIFEES
jgi:hypothetical protein